MQWSEVRQAYPNEWLIIEALEADTTPVHQRTLKRIAVIERCADSKTVLQSYRRLHQQFPFREFYFVHTSREKLDIREQVWVGIRSDHATRAPG
ncbi:MAG: hypothetical protein ACT4QE_24990 [Anaerolineales bacterium]